MLLYMSGNEVIGYNPNISKEEARQYLSEDVIFMEDIEFNYEDKEGHRVKITLDENNVPHYEYIELDNEQIPQFNSFEYELNQNQAEILLNQQEIIIKQNEQDEVLAAILLGQQTV